MLNTRQKKRWIANPLGNTHVDPGEFWSNVPFPAIHVKEHTHTHTRVMNKSNKTHLCPERWLCRSSRPDCFLRRRPSGFPPRWRCGTSGERGLVRRWWGVASATAPCLERPRCFAICCNVRGRIEKIAAGWPLGLDFSSLNPSTTTCVDSTLALCTCWYTNFQFHGPRYLTACGIRLHMSYCRMLYNCFHHLI